MTNPVTSCSSDCSDCPIEEGSRRPADAYRGPRFAAVSAAFFLGPLALAVAAAALSGPDPGTQFAGGAAGLAGGMAVAVLCARGARDIGGNDIGGQNTGGLATIQEVAS